MYLDIHAYFPLECVIGTACVRSLQFPLTVLPDLDAHCLSNITALTTAIACYFSSCQGANDDTPFCCI